MKLIQGDVIFKKIEEIPEGAIKVNFDDKVLQASEVTGNFHQFAKCAPIDLYQVQNIKTNKDGTTTITPNLGKYIVVHEDSTIFHGKLSEQPGKEFVPIKTGDHQSFVLPAGKYYVDITREYDYDLMEDTRVVD